MAETIRGIKLQVDLETSEFKAGLTEIKRQVNLASDSVKQFKRALKNDPSDADSLKFYKRSLEELEKAAKESKEGLQKLYKEMADSGMSGSDPKVVAVRNALDQLDNTLDKAVPKYKDFMNNIEGSAGSLEQMGEKSMAASVALGNLISEGVMKGLNALKSVFESILNVIGKVLEGFVEIYKTGIKYNIEMGRATASIKAILVDDAEGADNLVRSMKELGASTAFSVTELLKASQQLVAADVSAADAEKTIRDLGAAISFAGGGNDELGRMVQNLNQIKNAGKSTERDLKQFAYAGIPIYKLLAESSEKFAKDFKASEVTFEDITLALAKATEEGGRFASAYEVQSATLFGQLERTKANALALSGIIAGELTDSLKDTYLPALNEFLSSMTSAYEENGLEGLVEAFQTGLGDLLDVMSDEETINKVFEAATTLLQGIADAFDPTTERGAANKEKLDTVVANFGRVMGSLFAGLEDFFVGIGRTLGGALIKGFGEAVSSYFAVAPGNVDVGSRVGAIGQIFPGGSRSLGFGDIADRMNSGGFSSGVTLNANFTINNGNDIDQSTVIGWANTMVQVVNEELGGMV